MGPDAGADAPLSEVMPAFPMNGHSAAADVWCDRATTGDSTISRRPADDRGPKVPARPLGDREGLRRRARPHPPRQERPLARHARGPAVRDVLHGAGFTVTRHCPHRPRGARRVPAARTRDPTRPGRRARRPGRDDAAGEASRDDLRSKKRDPELLKPPATAAAWCTSAPARRRKGLGEVYADDPRRTRTSRGVLEAQPRGGRPRSGGNQGVPPRDLVTRKSIYVG